VTDQHGLAGTCAQTPYDSSSVQEFPLVVLHLIVVGPADKHSEGEDGDAEQHTGAINQTADDLSSAIVETFWRC
jgi:hypothetical protein